jgi:stage II sporulation protein AA (anti-sigma F factor antagonist)
VAIQINDVMEHVAHVVEIDEELDLSTIAWWEHRVEAAGRRSRTVVLDLTSVPFIDSAGVRTLFRWAVAAERVGIQLVVVAPPDSPVRRLLEILDLQAVAPLVDSRRKAVHACQGPGKPGP